MPDSLMAENGQQDPEVLVSQEVMLSVGLWMTVCNLAQVQGKAMAAESGQRHASSVEECLFDELPSRACPDWTAEKLNSSTGSGKCM